MPGAYDSHELPPERIKTVDVVKKHLCDLAANRWKLDEKKCQNCVFPCKYGLRLLELLGLPYIAPEKELLVKDLAKQGKPLPTIHQRIRNRGKK